MARKRKGAQNSKAGPASTVSDSSEEYRFYSLQKDKVHPRPYYLSSPPRAAPYSAKEKYLLGALVSVALSIAVSKYAVPSTMGAGERSTIQSINNYMKNQYELTTEPPLFPMLLLFVCRFLGYDGTKLDVHQYKFPPFFPVHALRSASATQNALIVLFSYFSLKALRLPMEHALPGAALVALDPVVEFSTRFISADAYALAALAGAVSLVFKLDNYEALSKDWLRTAYQLGLCLGALVSLKYYGFLTILWVLLVSSRRALILVSDVSLPGNKLVLLFRFLMASIAFSVLLPGAIFTGVNIVSLRLLLKVNTPDDVGYTFTSLVFQASLLGSDLVDENGKSPISLNVLYDSTVTIRHLDSLGGYLHLHNLTYLGKPEHQQVTLYNFKDDNNKWVIETKNPLDKRRKRFVSEGMTIKLRHKDTNKYLSASDMRGPVSEQEYHFEVSAKSEPEGSEHHWVIKYDVEYLKNQRAIDNAPGDSIIHPLGTAFRLYNRKRKCTLISHPITLPEWGKGQQEVVCVKDASLERSLFYIEENEHAQPSPNEPMVEIHKLSPWERVVMHLGFVVRLAKHYNIYYSPKTVLEVVPEEWVYNPNRLVYQGYDASGLHKMAVLYSPSRFVQLGGVLVLFSSVLVGGLWLLFHLKWVGKTILASKPTEENDLPFRKTPLLVLKFKSAAIDLGLGWAVHFLPYFIELTPRSPLNYIPAYYFLLLLICAVGLLGGTFGGVAVLTAQYLFLGWTGSAAFMNRL